MKKIFIILLAILSASGVFAQKPDSQGTEFWLMFTQNYINFPELTLFISGQTPATGEVTIPGLNFTQTFSVTPGTISKVTLPSTAYMSASDQVSDLGIHVTASEEISIYGLNRIRATTDAYLALPVDILGTEYLTLGYEGLSRYGENFGIVATQDNTTITITPAANAGFRAAGIPYDILLNKGQTYQLLSYESLTGSSIMSDKPIAVFSGSQCSNVPVNNGYCDYLVEQMFPLDAWGNNFVTVPLATRKNGDTFRILASEDNTSVRINDNAPQLLNAGEFYETILVSASTIESDKPVLVSQYSNGSTFDGVTSDPFMMLITPAEQFQAAYTVSTPESGFRFNFINLVVAENGISAIVMNGAPVDPSLFTQIGSTVYYGAQIPIEPGTYTLGGDVPFGAFIYGFDFADSYGYPGGTTLAPIASIASLELSDPTESPVPLGSEYCLTATVKDQFGEALSGILVSMEVSGTNTASVFGNTDENGIVRLCYTGDTPGPDDILVKAGVLTQRTSAEYAGGCSTETEPPVIVASGFTSANTPGYCGILLDQLSFESLIGLEVTDNCDDDVSASYYLGGEPVIFPYVFEDQNQVTIRASDSRANEAEEVVITVEVENESPVINELDLTDSPVLAGEGVTLNAEYTDTNLDFASVDWGDGQSGNASLSGNLIEATHSYDSPGLYSVALTLQDLCGETAMQVYEYVVVFDPDAGFVTGGGWYNSLAGMYLPDPALTGKAHYSFTVKYEDGGGIPTGNLNFKLGDVMLETSSFNWLVVNGNQAYFHGEGILNGLGEHTFFVAITDNPDPQGDDHIRIRIADSGQQVIYDNQAGAPLATVPARITDKGSIQIHKSESSMDLISSQMAVTGGEEDGIKLYPNPVSDQLRVDRSGAWATGTATLEIYDINGTRVWTGSLNAPQQQEINVRTLGPGVYYLRITGDEQIFIHRFIRK